MSEYFDYNLIKYLIAIVNTRSMVAASEVLDTPPAAVSYAVAKLRKHYNDPLFVRAKNGVKPTVLAMNLYEAFNPINQLLVDSIENRGDSISPRLEHPSIKIRANPLIEYWLTYHAIKQKIVPDKCTFDFVSHTNDMDERVNALRTQMVDIDIGVSMDEDRNITSTPLFNFELALICRNDHPRIKDSISLEQFSNENYMSRASKEGSANLSSEIESVLDSRIQFPWIRSESFINLLLNVIDNDLIMVFPKFFMPLITEKFPVKEVHCDFLKKKEVYCYAYTHKKKSKDPLISEIIGLIQ